MPPTTLNSEEPVNTPEKFLKNKGAGNLRFPAPTPQLFIPQRDSI